MKQKQYILVANSDREESTRLGDMIQTTGCRIHMCHSMGDMAAALADSDFMAVILDIDSLSIDNRAIRSLTLAYPDVRFLCTSHKRFHPDLKDALRHHIYACVNKPVDPDEMIYWVRCIKENQSDSRDPPPS